MIRLPGYCPELNPDELLNQDVKTNGLGKNRATTRAEFMAIVRRHLYRRQTQPQTYFVSNTSAMQRDELRTICWSAQYVAIYRKKLWG